MNQSAETWFLLGAAALFVLFLVLKTRGVFAPRAPDYAEGRKALLEAKRRASTAPTSTERARAWRDASQIALERLERPRLAAAFAIRAERAEPGDAASFGVLAGALRGASRFQALETLLWRRLALGGDKLDERAFEELVSLYEGPMRRPERAQVLRRLRTRS